MIDIFNKVLNFATSSKAARKEMLSMCLDTHDIAKFKNTDLLIELIEELIYVERCMFDVAEDAVKIKIEFCEGGIVLIGECSNVTESLPMLKEYSYWGTDNIVIVKGTAFKNFIKRIKGFINIALSDNDIVRFFSHKSVNYYEFYTKELEPRTFQRMSVAEYLNLT